MTRFPNLITDLSAGRGWDFIQRQKAPQANATKTQPTCKFQPGWYRRVTFSLIADDHNAPRSVTQGDDCKLERYKGSWVLDG